ncbi:hypothetical protein [Bacillus sp. Marseille-P3800]|uniref:hypothetical protein n=1 Tax=Bacillus sp. Marseille-P3800 TaxID=2014782 RepID=UPI000C07D768|nr:hypothetical protein [Bacillus sp. Marseille-P3800]
MFVDKMFKFHRDQKAGINQYWIVDPVDESTDVFVLKMVFIKKKGPMQTMMCSFPSFEGLDIHIKDLFV